MKVMRKVLDGIAVLSLLISGGIAGAGIYLYFYVTNPVNQDKAKSYVMEQVTGALPGLIGDAMAIPPLPPLPSMTGPAIPSIGGEKTGESSAPANSFIPEQPFSF